MVDALTRCDFCNELSGCPENSFAQLYGPNEKSRVLFRTDNFVVVPSLGQIAEGYLLLLPVKHFRATGDMPDHLLDEFVEVCRQVGQILRDQYGPYVLFEHGARSEGAGGCGIYHAHVHATPIPAVSDPINTLKKRFPCAVLGNVKEISGKSAGLASYLFYRELS